MAALVEGDIRARLTTFYQHYDPSKLDDLDKILKKYAGNEDKLIRALVRKYGPEPEPQPQSESDNEEEEEDEEEDDSNEPVPPMIHETYEQAMNRMFKERLTTFYAHYDPSKTPQVDSLMEKYAGKEQQLMAALVKKYGPEPTPGKNEDEADDDDEEDDDDARPPTVAVGKGGAEDDDEEMPMDRASKCVVYCAVCGLPPDYCEYGPDFDKCRPWLEENAPWVLADDLADDMEGLEMEDGKKKKKSKRGGQGPKRKTLDESKQHVEATTTTKGKRVVTHVLGLEYFPDLKLKDAAKALGKRFACATAIKETPTGEKEVQIQGDVLYELTDVLESLLSISPKKVTIKEEVKKKKKEKKIPPPQPGPRRDSDE